MQFRVSSFVALFLSFGLLLTGGGLLSTLIGVRMSLEWFPTSVIGLVTACYSLGFVLATRVCGRLIVGVGHIRTFAGLSALAATCTLAYPMWIDPLLWGAMRFIYGFSLAGLYMVVESWLNDRTPRIYRGRIFGIYSIVTYVGLGGGQFLLMAGDVRSYTLFSFSAMLIALAVVPVTVWRQRSPDIIEVASVGLRRLFDAAPLGMVGAMVAGAINGAFLGMAPVYAKGAQFDSDEVAWLMGLGILGGFALQYPIGRLSDRFDRRHVIATVSAAVAMVSVAIGAVTFGDRWLIVALTVLWGGLAFTLYPLSVSLTNDCVEPSELLGASAGLLLVHGLGMIVGPVASAQLMALVGPVGLFAMLAFSAVVLCVYALMRLRVAEPLREEASEYTLVARNTPYGSYLDPRNAEVQLEFDFDGSGVDREPAPGEESTK